MAEKTPLSTPVRRSIEKLGADLGIARRKRRLRLSDVSDATGLSVGTIQRLEQGNPHVSLGALVSILRVYGEGRRLYDLLDTSSDDTGLLLTQAELPKRIRRRKADLEPVGNYRPSFEHDQSIKALALDRAAAPGHNFEAEDNDEPQEGPSLGL